MPKNYQESEIRAVEDFKEYGAELVPCSGALPNQKLDVTITDEGLIISNKHTVKGSVSFKLADIKKDENQAKFMGLRLIRRIEFEDPNTGKLNKYILLDQEQFKSMLHLSSTQFEHTMARPDSDNSVPLTGQPTKSWKDSYNPSLRPDLNI